MYYRGPTARCKENSFHHHSTAPLVVNIPIEFKSWRLAHSDSTHIWNLRYRRSLPLNVHLIPLVRLKSTSRLLSHEKFALKCSQFSLAPDFDTAGLCWHFVLPPNSAAVMHTLVIFAVGRQPFHLTAIVAYTLDFGSIIHHCNRGFSQCLPLWLIPLESFLDFRTLPPSPTSSSFLQSAVNPIGSPARCSFRTDLGGNDNHRHLASPR